MESSLCEKPERHASRRLSDHLTFERSEAEGPLSGGQSLSDRTAAHRVQAGRAGLTDTFASGRKSPFMKAGCGKTARPVCAADGGQRKSNRTRLQRTSLLTATASYPPKRAGRTGLATWPRKCRPATQLLPRCAKASHGLRIWLQPGQIV